VWSTRNVPIAEIHNFCILNGLEFNVKDEEVVIVSWHK